jgi:hypothetical protein
MGVFRAEEGSGTMIGAAFLLGKGDGPVCWRVSVSVGVVRGLVAFASREFVDIPLFLLSVFWTGLKWASFGENRLF